MTALHQKEVSLLQVRDGADGTSGHPASEQLRFCGLHVDLGGVPTTNMEHERGPLLAAHCLPGARLGSMFVLKTVYLSGD